MALDTDDGSTEIVRFSNEWVETYVDICERNDSTDPMYGENVSRDVMRDRVLTRMRSPARGPEAHFLAIQGGEGVGSARGVVVPTCGEEGQEAAILSLMVSPSHRGLGIGTRLVNRVRDEIDSQGVRWIDIAVLDAWEGWERFLRSRGFSRHDVFVDVVLHPEVEVLEHFYDATTIRPIRLPEEREKVLAIYDRERGEGYPQECAVVPGQPAWWEVEPWASHFDPGGFLVAEEKGTGELVGYVSASFIPGHEPQALIDYVDVVKSLLGTGLRERLLVRAVTWLRGKGAADVVSRVHFRYRGEDELFQRVGFELQNRATVWRRSTAGTGN